MAEAITSIGGGWRVFGSPRLALQLPALILMEEIQQTS